jgi:D-alanyl-lipoteichoic acid acyltransferase DltB (MBOAT superfamily)
VPFNSYQFVVFAATTVILYNLIPARHRALLLLLASFLFYADSSVPHLLLLCLVTAATYRAARIIEARRSRMALAASIVAVTLPLFAFKYYGFFTGLTMQLLGFDGRAVEDFALPLGISFFTFQAISYIVDVHRGSTRAERRLDSVGLYLAFFPKLLAGPIERARDLVPQLQTLVQSTASNVYAGLKFALWGFFCKLVVADNIGSIVDGVLKAPHQESGATLSIVFALYAFEIYFDFLGYTNIAIGVARCFNIRLNPNFNSPYAATSLRDFWRRWHISLSTWFRDYVYIPLGGNTTSGMARIGQIGVVFLVSGLWHGAALHFAAWGAFHGAAYWGEEQLRRRMRWVSWPSHGALRLLQQSGQRVLTFGVVTLAWVFFRLSDFSSIGAALERMAFVNTDVAYTSLNEILTRADSGWFFLILLSAIILDSSREFRASLDRVPESSGRIIGELAYVNWLCVTLVLLGDLGVRDFTYFGF